MSDTIDILFEGVQPITERHLDRIYGDRKPSVKNRMPGFAIIKDDFEVDFDIPRGGIKIFIYAPLSPYGYKGFRIDGLKYIEETNENISKLLIKCWLEIYE